LANQLKVSEHAAVVLAVDPDQVPENNDQDSHISDANAPVGQDVAVVYKEAMQPAEGGRAVSNLVEQIKSVLKVAEECPYNNNSTHFFAHPELVVNVPNPEEHHYVNY
jgi:hypothetical protein